MRLLVSIYQFCLLPFNILIILHSKRIHPAYRMTVWRKLQLGFRMYRITKRIPTGTSYKSHLAMALKILETPLDVLGDIVECGTWKGSCAASLSLVCDIADRKLKIFDSFEGLPLGEPGDREAPNYQKGEFCGTLNEVKANIARYGKIERCEFIKGWLKDTLPHLDTPVLLAFVDVDLEASLHIAVKYLWPNLVEQGYIFIDEFTMPDYCALFYSEKWWSKNFNRTPPGLIGAGIGLALGDYYIGPWSERDVHPLHHPKAGAYTRKDWSGYWAYYPDESPE